MDYETRKIAIEKLDLLVTSIAYPDEFLDNGKIEKYYQKLNFQSKDYFSQILDAKLFQFNDYYDWYEPIIPNDWTKRRQALKVNAWYIQWENRIGKLLLSSTEWRFPKIFEKNFASRKTHLFLF